MHRFYRFCCFSIGLLLSAQLSAMAVQEPEASMQEVSPIKPAVSKVDPEKGGASSAGEDGKTQSPPVKKAQPTKDAITLDGVSVTPQGYNINDENYFKLRDIAYLMKEKRAHFQVQWDTETRSIALLTGSPYQVVGGEMEKKKGKWKVQPSGAKVQIDGVPFSMKAYNIQGNNYFRLRDIGEQIGFGVDYQNKVITLTDKPISEYTVTFQNEKGNAPSAQVLQMGEVPVKPSTQTAEGFVFAGWFLDEAGTQMYMFDKPLDADTTLYAKWEKAESVTFDNGGKGKKIPKVWVPFGGKVAEPEAPTADDYRFEGWYIDKDCTIRWVFEEDTVTRPILLYAKWSRMDSFLPAPDWTPLPRVDGNRIVLLDAGHGGSDPGEIGNGLEENAVNLSVTLHLKSLLEGAGVQVVMTREELDTSLKGPDRMEKVRSLMAQYPLDLSISIHHNGGRAKGAEVFAQNDTQDPEGNSKKIGRLVLEEFKNMGQSLRGLKTSNLYMTRVPSERGVPGILTEFCFLDNEEDAQRIDTIEEQQAEAEAIYRAIMSYFTQVPY